MMKWVLRLAWLLVCLVVVLAISVLFLPTERIARIAAEQLQAATGRDVSISGVDLSFWPVLGVRAHGLEVGNAGWAEQGPMLQTKNAAIGVDAMSLLRGDIRITHIEAFSPTIRLEQKADGRASWQFSNATGEAQIVTETTPSRPAKPISIEQVEVRDATFVYDAEGSDLVSFSGVDLTLDWPERQGPAEISGRLQPANTPVTIDALINGFGGFLVGDVQALTATLGTDAGTVEFDGRASTAGAVAGQVSLQTGDTDEFLRSLGLAGAALPPKLGREIDLKTELTLTPDRKLSLRDLVIDLGGNRLTGAADVDLNGVPNINAQLDAGALDLRGAGGTSSNAAPATPSSTPAPAPASGTASAGWPADRIDASALAAFNGTIALSAASIGLETFQLGATKTILRNENARMVFELRSVEAYQGLVTGEFVVNNRNGLSVGGRLAADAIQLQPLLADAADLSRLTGQGNLKLTFLGAGSSVDQIMRSLSGDGSLVVGKGTIEGINLDRLMQSGDVGAGTTIFDNLTATWTISGGVLSNRDLLFELKNYRASGEGTVGLGTQTLDYTFTPVALRANSGQGLAIPVRFRGPWSDISIQPDVEAALQSRLDKEQEALEQKAQEKLQEKLGITPSEGQSTEDAIKDKLLRKLFE
jgi:AsmA protein